jgi:hypothetical protein
VDEEKRLPLGMATEFYRLRVVKLDEGDSPDLEWRDDILYREPPADTAVERDAYQVEAVTLGGDEPDESAVTLASFETAEAAREWSTTAEEDLREMTRMEFEERYFPVA